MPHTRTRVCTADLALRPSFVRRPYCAMGGPACEPPSAPEGKAVATSVDNIVLRGLSRDDFGKGMMELLGQLTDSSGVSSEDFAKRADELIQDSRTHVVVAEDTATGRVVGTAKLLVELKFTRQLGKVRHACGSESGHDRAHSAWGWRYSRVHACVTR